MLSTTTLTQKKASSLSERLKSQRRYLIQRISHVVLLEVHKFFDNAGFIQVMPVILSPVTDPLCHSVYDSEINVYSQRFKLTKSMIFHKQLILMQNQYKGIYCISPNVRLERSDIKDSKRHLFEFQQVDFEIPCASMDVVMNFMEELFISVVGKVKKRCNIELSMLSRKLMLPEKGFPVYDSVEMEKKLGPNYEQILSDKSKTPFWLTNLEREFYDREDPQKRGTFRNFDLILPEGFGELLSGGEREYEGEQIRKMMKRAGTSEIGFELYLTFADQGLIPPSAGAGFGVQRFVRFFSGVKEIDETTIFDRRPDVEIDF